MSQDTALIISKIREVLKTAIGELDKIEENYKRLVSDSKLDPTILETLNWKPYKNALGSWVYVDRELEAGPLKEALLKAPKKTLDIGLYRYNLGGDRLQFIGRHRIGEKLR